MKVNVDLLLQLRKDRAWSQDELAIAAGLNLRTIQRIEKEASVSLQSKKALASAFNIDIHDLDQKETSMLNELIGKHVLIEMGVISGTFAAGMTDNVKGEITEIKDNWLKLSTKNQQVYVNISLIKRITPST